MKNRTKYLLVVVIFAAVTVIAYNLFKIPRSDIVNILNFTKIKHVFTKKKNITIIEEFLPKNEFINIVNQTVIKHSFLRGNLRSGGKRLVIFLHYRGDLISDAISASETWESHLMVHFESYIKSHPGIQVLDVGCNLGVYTLTAAALGCKVVAVDANPENTARLSQSLIANGLQNKATICLNAISDVRKRFVVDVVSSNIGGSSVKEVDVNNKNSVQTIFMNDLIPFFDKNYEIVLKIDIEGSEINALKEASKLFNQRNITFVMMEWEHIKKKPEIQYVINFFISRQFKPCTNYQKTQLLDVANFMSWPYDIFWIK